MIPIKAIELYKEKGLNLLACRPSFDLMMYGELLRAPAASQTRAAIYSLLLVRCTFIGILF